MDDRGGEIRAVKGGCMNDAIAAKPDNQQLPTDNQQLPTGN